MAVRHINMSEFNIGDGLRLQKLSMIRNPGNIINKISNHIGKDEMYLHQFRHILEYDKGGHGSD